MFPVINNTNPPFTGSWLALRGYAETHSRAYGQIGDLPCGRDESAGTSKDFRQ